MLVFRVAASRLRSVPRQQIRLLCGKPPAGKPPADKPLAVEMPDATTLFKATNPELMLDHKKRTHWIPVGLTIAFFSAYMAYTAIVTDRMLDVPAAPKDVATQPLETQVHKVLPDGRVLLKDGSIVKAPERS